MTAWVAKVPPRLGTVDGPGWCLRFAQSFFGAPAMYDSAWDAWEATQHRYGPEVPLPDVPVLLWFEHWGWYGPKGQERYGNWGDVRIHVPGDAIYGSPITGSSVGQSRVATIGEIERGIGATYAGWSPDINGLLVAEPGEEDDMYSDADRARDNKAADQINSIFRAIFEIDIAAFSKREHGIGRELLNTRKSREEIRSVFRAMFEIDIDDFAARPEGIGRELLKLRDTQFGGVEAGGSVGTLAMLDAIIAHLGIVLPAEPDTSPEG